MVFGAQGSEAPQQDSIGTPIRATRLTAPKRCLWWVISSIRKQSAPLAWNQIPHSLHILGVATWGLLCSSFLGSILYNANEQTGHNQKATTWESPGSLESRASVPLASRNIQDHYSADFRRRFVVATAWNRAACEWFLFDMF